ncbi:MAG: nucleotidyltransferase family protein [Rhodospirillales bacterium]|nr:nucleotidyltransferase family protein [Rhodospirillales bacterium]
MTRDEVLALLRTHKKALAEQFNVTDLALFGSIARNRAAEDSDVDLLVRFAGRATSARNIGTQFYIEDLLGRSVDLVTDSALRRELRPYVEREALQV